MTDNLNRQGTQLVVFAVAERLTWCYNDGLTRMDPQGVEILHVADGDTVIVLVAHHFVLYFLPTFQRLLNKHLRRERESLFGLSLQLLLIVAESRAQSAEGIGGTQYNGIAQFCRCLSNLFNGVAGFALDGLDINLVKTLYEKVAVFGIDDSLDRSAENLHAIAFENAILEQFYATVEGCLSTKGEQYAVRTFLGDDTLYEVCTDGLEIYLVGYAFGGLYRCDIRIDKDGLDTFFLQCFQSLRTAVVKFTCLTNLQGTTAEKEDFFDRWKR